MGAQNYVPEHTRPNVDAEMDFIPTFADGMRTIPSPGSTVVDNEHTLKYKTCFASLQNFVQKEIRNVFISWMFAKLHPSRKSSETEVRSVSSGVEAIVNKCFDDRRFEQSHIIARYRLASPCLSFHSCKFGTFIGWRPYSPRAT